MGAQVAFGASMVNIPVEMVHYRVSQAEVQEISRGLAKALLGSAATVNVILPPGPI